MSSRPLLFATLAGVLAAALVVVSIVAVAQSRRASAEAARADELRAEVAELERRVAELEAEAAAGRSELEELLGGLLGGGDAGDLSGLLEGLLGGAGGGLLDELLPSGGDLAGARCLVPDGGGSTGGGLLGDGGLLDGLGSLFGGSSQARPDPDATVTEIAGQVEQLRELDLVEPVEVEFLSDVEVLADLDRILDGSVDPEELAAQQAVLAALRAIPADADLEQLQRDLLTDQVAGYYDPDDGRLVVRVPDGGQLRTLDRVTIAHEVGHALVDQAIGLPDLDDDADADAALARLAVVEGDATLLMNRWTLTELSVADQLGMAGAGDLATQQAQLATYPHHLQRELLFPYTAGLDLVCDRYLDGGWSAVDAAYDELPTTTAEVLFPDAGPVTATSAPALSTPAGGSLRYQDTFGAAPLSWLFEAPGGDPAAALDRPVDRARAWAGGEVRLWEVADDPVVGLTLAATGGDDDELCASVTAWWDAAAPASDARDDGDVVAFTEPGTAAAIRCDGAGVRFAVARSKAAATQVVGARR